MFTIYVHKTLDDLFKHLDANYPCDWYARPDTYEAECWLSERGII